MDSPRFSIIMPCYNTVEYTIQAFQSILKHTEDYELIIVNDASSDETASYLVGAKALAKKRGVEVTIHTNLEAAGFTCACNQGAKYAKGQYLVFVNNDIVATPFWVARMAACLEQIEDNLPIGKFGITGPASNYAAGMQLVQDVPRPFPMDRLDQYAEQWHQQNQQKWVYSGFISGFCIMITRECWDTVEGFDERFTPGGFEDNDICRRAFHHGYKSVISGDVFVYHYGTKSTNLPERRFMRGGLHNRGKYYTKYWDEVADTTIPVVAGYRIKNGARWLRETLDKTVQCVDHICVLDDGSDDDTPEILNEYTVKHKGMFTVRRHNRPFQELRDRNELWQMMYKASKDINADIDGWGLILDADEVLEDKVTYDYLQHLARPVHPDIHGYIFKVDTFWRGRENIRADGTFGYLRGVRMVRFAKDQKLWTPHPQGLHCGNTPTVPPDWLATSSIRIKHYGFEDFEIAQKKFEFYQKTDTVKDPMTVGGDGSYRHLIDETQLSLKPWREKNSIGLAMIGRNEGEFLNTFFERNYFFSLFDQIVYVDCGSDDASMTQALAYGAEVYELPKNLIFQDGPFKGRLKHFGKARNYAKSKMKTEWILMMDADEYIDKDMIPHLLRLTENDYHGYRFHVQNHQPNGTVSHSENIRMFRNIDDLYYTQHVHESLETAINRLGNKARFAMAPFPLHHMGYLRPPQYVQLKLDHYEHLNEQDLNEDPADARPYFNLALHYINEGDVDKGKDYLEKAVERHPGFMQSWQELGRISMRQAALPFERANAICPEGHPMKAGLKEVVEFLRKHGMEPMKVGVPKQQAEAAG